MTIIFNLCNDLLINIRTAGFTFQQVSLALIIFNCFVYIIYKLVKSISRSNKYEW